MQNENGVLAEQEEIHNALVDKYVPIWDKKHRSKGESIWVFQRRTLSSACQVATTLHDMDFGKASTFLFHLVREADGGIRCRDGVYGKHLRGPDWRCHGGRHSHRWQRHAPYFQRACTEFRAQMRCYHLQGPERH